MTKIAAVGAAALSRRDHVAVAISAVEQLARLTVYQLSVRRKISGYAVGQLRESIFSLAELALGTIDAAGDRRHASYFAPYFSGTKQNTLKHTLITIVNRVAEEDDASLIDHVAHNFAEWSEGLFEQTRKLLVMSVTVRSGFTFDLSHWIADVSQILLALASNEMCERHLAEKLRKNALFLMGSFSWVATDRDTVSFVENYQWTEQLFRAALLGRARGDQKYEKEAFEMLLHWAGAAGRHQSGWAILEQALCGLAVLAAEAKDKLDLLSETIRGPE